MPPFSGLHPASCVICLGRGACRKGAGGTELFLLVPEAEALSLGLILPQEMDLVEDPRPSQFAWPFTSDCLFWAIPEM